MNYRLRANKDEMCLAITVSVKMPTKVRVKVFDEKKQKIVFTDRYKTIQSQDTFFVRMPMTSDSMIISVYDDNRGNIPANQEKNISIAVKKIPLEKRLDVVDITNPLVNNFVRLAQQFCYNSPYLEVNRTYESQDGKLLIEYLDVIIGKNGAAVTTPARISKTTGRIQVAKKYFDQYTLPMKFAILCHEFSHFYINEDIDNETEADLNGLLIYLGLGYPRIEAYQAFLEVFKDAPSEQNKKRFDVIDRFIKNFEKDKMILS